jgi:hypothetical protein
MMVGSSPPCETCAERGRERPGVHPVGSGYLCDPCWRGEGSRAERTIADTPPSVRESRRRYREKNRARFVEYQRHYRERKTLEKEPARAGNQVLYEAGPDTVQPVPGP